MKDEELIRVAIEARKNAYAPYSHFCVGAALLGASGRVYTGCNVENAAFSPTSCAERNAFFTAIGEGERRFVAIAVTGGKEGDAATLCTPCGVCRQVMTEFCKADFRVVLGGENEIKAVALKELMPHAFSAEDIV